MRKVLTVLLAAIVAASAWHLQRGPADRSAPASRPDAASSVPDARSPAGDTALRDAIASRARDVQVTGAGVVDRVLADDRDGSRHQRFILRLASGQTLLIAHNIDLAPRLESLDPGERVEFAGEYEWTGRGGVVHWTHHDPAGRHPGGWLRHEGRTAR